ncbi:MAG: transketolase C-terminal domain-containing protein [Candidatus Pacebacteria bacterium]|jgi:transketolase|nr:transketolase C-terminal domain-containing protein [Candidatus Paceibacterota bacterium]|tara:strand:- start:10603 stop:11598 length:996 start_codon:yes stop_codon:yes gene_type:complete
MINKQAKLVDNIFDKDSIERGPTRDGFGKGLVQAGEKDERVVALCADLLESTRMQWFAERFPERYIEIGVAEQNLATVASGLANYGKIPFIASYAVFSPGRNNEQIRTTISLNNVPVKIVGSHAGVSVGPDGATHQALEDIALMRVQPNMTVTVPADVEEARKATIAAAEYDGPVYIRLAREKSSMFTTPDTPFEIGKAQIFFESEEARVAIIVCGNLVHNALLAADNLEKDGIGTIVLNNHTIKPMDNTSVIEMAKKTGAVVTVEEHQIAGGMGSAVAEVLAGEHPVPIEFVGVHDQFGQSGDPDELIEHYNMGVEEIISAVKKVIERKA